MESVEYYLNLPYVIKIVRLDDGDYLATYDEKALNKKVLLAGDGASESEAISELKEAFACYVDDALKCGEIIPLPKAARELTQSLSITIRQSLLQKADIMAKNMGISRSALISKAVESYANI